MKIHFISIGGAVMHNLAIALYRQGHNISGSDDQIYEPSRSNLLNTGLLPKKIGYYESNIHENLDFIILGMHAKKTNIELVKSKKIGLKILSYPEFIYNFSKNKLRVVIAGSHGKTTITSMLIFILKKLNFDFDYLVGSKYDGLETSVKLSDSPIIIIEGDEYPSSVVDKIPKFHVYKPNYALISGISWDHINVYKTFQDYINQFSTLLSLIKKNGYLTFNFHDKYLTNLISENHNFEIEPYKTPKYLIKKEITYLFYKNKKVKLNIFGKHNLLNLMGALNISKKLGISEIDFFHHIKDFKGSNNRMQKVFKKKNICVYKDFAHSPSKVYATASAFREQFNNSINIGILELSTFSSLNRIFLKQYKNSMKDFDFAYIFYDEEKVIKRNMEILSNKFIIDCFCKDNLIVIRTKKELLFNLLNQKSHDSKFIFMSSSNFNNFSFKNFFNEL